MLILIANKTRRSLLKLDCTKELQRLRERKKKRKTEGEDK